MKVSLPRGIASISGTLSRSCNGNKLVAKTFKKANGSTETRVYIMPPQQRSTPVTPREQANRARFAQASLFFNNLTPEEQNRYAQAMRKDRNAFNGKKYATLRGYVIARFFQNAVL